MDRKYNHPYSPYEIQVQLMDAIYDAINGNYKVGLFESPTGTGKTLSIICAAMTWLREYKKNNAVSTKKPLLQVQLSDSEEPESSDDEPEWVKQAYLKSIAAQTKEKAIEYEKHLQDLLTSVTELTTDYKEEKNRRKKIRPNSEDEFAPDDYFSDSELALVEGQNTRLAAEIRQLTNRIAGGDEETSLPPSCPHPIYFTSRTHSQLSQFAEQLRLTSFDTSLAVVPEKTKFLPLGSRKQLCINPKVSNLASLAAINDACVDLQKKKEHKCEYYPLEDNSRPSGLVRQFMDYSYSKIHDIEDLGNLGSKLQICPYYSVRSSTDIAEIVALPYQMLLMTNAREIMNLNIDNAVVVIDESHNLIDTITSLNSVSIKLSELTLVIKSLKLYLNKFSRRLNSGNRIHLLKLIKLCQSVEKFLNGQNTYKTGDFVDHLEIFKGSTADMINVHKLDKFLAKSKIAYKIETYMSTIDDINYVKSSSNPILFKISHFLRCLTNKSREGQFVWTNDNDDVAINYILLDPSFIFEDIIKRARCVLLCGGTMEPMEDYLQYLFPSLPKEKVKTFTCGHLIPPENLNVFPIHSMNNITFEFSYEKRNQHDMIGQLGIFLISLFAKVPEGIVIFLPSYKYLHHVMEVWRSSGLLKQMESAKEVFQEAQNSQLVDSILKLYTKAINKSSKGACLFSVVGGKMSEGINFADDLARAVVVVGLPFPNALSAEMIAKRNFIVDSCLAKGQTKSQAMESAKLFYENICMRSVNQSVGRSIRHSKDYACIYLIDQRYNKINIQHKLSKWVRDRIQANHRHTEQVFSATELFFSSKQTD